VVLDPDSDQERVRFGFPRQPRGRRLCISDFFREDRDTVGFFVVTAGPRVSEVSRELFESNRYREYLLLHGFGVEFAEGLAELWHRRMRQELGIGSEDAATIEGLFRQGYRGSRYAFGYPACPNLEDQEKIFTLLEPSRIGVCLTENWQLEPEQSTSAVVVHHPEAKYFNVG
jgi:5-methyltetrahydrofolate--homocysteine methyltransferase